MKWIARSGIDLGTFPVLECIAPQLEVTATSRRGGFSRAPFDSLNLGEGMGDRRADILKNRKLLFDTLEIHGRGIARAAQVHGHGIRIVNRGGVSSNADGLVTATKGLTLAISTADCYPVIIYSPSERILAALHAGRNGARKGIIGLALDLMRKRFRIDPGNTISMIGPGICKKCYTVDRGTAGLFPEEVTRMRGGKWHLDLLSFCKIELKRAGIEASHIYSADTCTSCNPDLFFSHRRDGGRTGRQWTLARINRLP